MQWSFKIVSDTINVDKCPRACIITSEHISQNTAPLQDMLLTWLHFVRLSDVNEHFIAGESAASFTTL